MKLQFLSKGYMELFDMLNLKIFPVYETEHAKLKLRIEPGTFELWKN